MMLLSTRRPLARLSLALAAPFALALALGACTAKKASEEGTTDTAAADTATVAEAQPSKTDEFFQSLPSPIHLARIFNRSGLKYVAGLTSPADKATSYQSASARALNLGVYTTDLAYSTFNNQNQSAVSYFKAVRTLGDGLNMSSMFEQTSLVPRFEKNLGNKDSLIYLMSQLSLESDLLLKNASRLDVVYLSFAGAWTESIYLSTAFIAQSKNLEIYNRVLDQQNSLAKLIKLLEDYPENKELGSTIEGLKGILVKLEGLNDTKANPDSKDYAEFAEAVKSFRNTVIKEV